MESEHFPNPPVSGPEGQSAVGMGAPTLGGNARSSMIWSSTADVDEAARSFRLQSALEGIDQAIVVCDAGARTVFQNQAAVRLLSGHPGDALVSQAVSEVIQEALSGARPERRLLLKCLERLRLWSWFGRTIFGQTR